MRFKELEKYNLSIWEETTNLPVLYFGEEEGLHHVFGFRNSEGVPKIITVRDSDIVDFCSRGIEARMLSKIEICRIGDYFDTKLREKSI